MSPPCVLCVEESGEHRGQLVELLEAEGYRVDLAEDGRAALLRLQRRPRPVLILMSLTGAHGNHEAAGLIRKDPTLADVPVVAVTAPGAPVPADGAFGTRLEAPVQAGALAACLDEVLGGSPDDALAPVRRALRELIEAEGTLEVSLAEARRTLADLVAEATPEEHAQPERESGHKA